MVSGRTGGVTKSCTPAECPQRRRTLFQQVAAHGGSWRVLAESMPGDCRRTDASPYVVRLATTRLVRGINALGYPALSIPCGLSGSGLPVGLQLVGPAFEEARILRLGAALEDGGVGVPACPTL